MATNPMIPLSGNAMLDFSPIERAKARALQDRQIAMQESLLPYRQKLLGNQADLTAAQVGGVNADTRRANALADMDEFQLGQYQGQLALQEVDALLEAYQNGATQQQVEEMHAKFEADNGTGDGEPDNLTIPGLLQTRAELMAGLLPGEAPEMTTKQRDAMFATGGDEEAAQQLVHESMTRPVGTTVTVNTGDLEGSTKGGIEKELVELSDVLDMSSSLESSFRPEFHELDSRFDALVTRGKAKLGFDISPEERKVFEDYAEYKANASQQQSTVIKQLSGAAVNEAEERRLLGFLIDPGAGLFDGDDPITAEIKIKRFVRDTQRAIARRNWLLGTGREPNEENFNRFPLQSIDKIFDARHSEIMSELARQNPNAPAGQIERMADERVSREFGIR